MVKSRRKQSLTELNIVLKNSYEILLSNDVFNKIPIVSLEQAVQPLVSILPTIKTYVRMVKEKCQNPSDGLTSDESASIMLYSIGWQPFNQCLYTVLNSTLRTVNRQNFQPWLLYIKLLFAALLRLPSMSSIIYRISKSDLTKFYEKDEIFTWWDFSLCTTSIEHLQIKKSFNQTEINTLFIIECDTIKDIRKHTYFQSDNSVLILPGTQFQVIDCSDENNHLQRIYLQQIQPSNFLQTKISRKKSTNFFKNFRFWSCRKASTGSLFTQRLSLLNGAYRNVTIEQLIVESSRSWTVDLDEQNITNRDMKIVVKYAIIKNHCKRIRLRDNHITSEGASILAEGFINNTTLESLDLRNNFISDLGVQPLALAIISSNLKTLNLESNGITCDGAQYLAQMLKTNRTLTELYLSKNHLGDRGVELLTNALNDEKIDHQDDETRPKSPKNPSTLQHLYLGQNDITDVGIEHIANMLKINRMLTWVLLSGNNISDHGVKLLANTLADHNNSLEWLFLNSNKDISDTSVDALIPMLKRNHSLKTIYINNCNLSETGKQKLQDITKTKKDFDLEV